MSGHLRSGFAALVLCASAATPAAANPFTDLFPSNAAPAAPAVAPAPAQEKCLLQPGKSTAADLHWVYRVEGGRKCWFQTRAGAALARKPVQPHAARQRAAAPEGKESAPRRDEAVEDARAEMQSPAPATAPQPTPSEPAVRMVQTVPVPVTEEAAQVLPADVPASPRADRLALNQPPPQQVDVEALLADAPAASDELASDAGAAPVAATSAGTSDSGGWTTPWLGALLMMLGIGVLLSALRPVRFLTPERGSRSPRPTAETVFRSAGVHAIGQRRARRAF
jgi:hypothetical protein